MTDAVDDETLRRMLAELDPDVDPPPADLRRIVSGLFEVRTIDAEILELLTSDDALAGAVRAAEVATVWSFRSPTSGDVAVTAQIDEEGALVVDVEDDAVAQVVLRQPGRSDRGAPVDIAGGCRFEDVPDGPLQLVALTDDGTPRFQSDFVTLR